MTFTEMESAVKESVRSKMQEEPHTNQEVEKKIIEVESEA